MARSQAEELLKQFENLLRASMPFEDDGTLAGDILHDAIDAALEAWQLIAKPASRKLDAVEAREAIMNKPSTVSEEQRTGSVERIRHWPRHLTAEEVQSVYEDEVHAFKDKVGENHGTVHNME